ncbi:MAG: hypothetical protein GY838_03285 [bacterium]|nr:hypothetical protein [bacterium]
MGFGSILDLFRSDNWSNNLVEKISEMLELAEAMFAYTSGIIVEGKDENDRQVMLYDRDIRINHLERKIRRRVVSRLSAQTSQAEVPSALIFMNVVKDGERMGDYVKNMYEVRAMMPESVDFSLYHEHLAGFTATIEDLFGLVRRAFAESDEELAGQVIKRAKAEGKAHEEAIRQITGSDLGTCDAVCIVLLLRFYKRIVSHMSNIATTVVMPVDMIDFYDEPEE